MLVVCANGGETVAFEDPFEVIRAETSADVALALEAADRAVEAGAYVAGFVTYEAGLAFVPRQSPPRAGALPLLQIGVYRAPSDLPLVPDRTIAIGPLVPEISRARYDANVANVLERIRDGEVYQINLAVPFTFAFDGDPYALYDALSGDGAFPYAAYVGMRERAIVSCSPELFVRFEDGVLTTKPMKGTSSRGDTATLSSAKNRAEHVMIVDLLRNDMNKLSAAVTVEKLAERERYPSFETMTSTIVATRDRPFSLAETFGAMFPCGSITGAPKVTAMQAIARHEGVRDIFCGSIGFRGPGGAGTWNVAIRTATIDRARGRGTIHIGGGIVADSSARDEWAEILVKRRFIDRLAPEYALIETLRRDAVGTYDHLERHIARLARSADDLHFVFDEVAVRRVLADTSITEELIRLELALDGRLTLAHRSLHDESAATAMWSSQIVDPDEPLQRYKTTWRRPYDIAAAEARARNAFDAVLLTADGNVADGSRTNVFIDPSGDGTLLTPRIADGALPGILREKLIAEGTATERRLTQRDIAEATYTYLGNSARGLRRVRFS